MQTLITESTFVVKHYHLDSVIRSSIQHYNKLWIVQSSFYAVLNAQQVYCKSCHGISITLAMTQSQDLPYIYPSIKRGLNNPKFIVLTCFHVHVYSNSFNA